MADLTTVADFPPWSISYSYSENNPVVRTASSMGYVRQSNRGHKAITVASAVRILTGIQLQYFESFVRGQTDYGQQAFTDKYKDGGGVQSGLIRIVGGSYSVSTKDKIFEVSCSLEVFR